MRASLTALFLLFAPIAVSAQDSSADYSEPYQQRALEIYRTIIGYRTAAGHGQVPVLANYLADQFRVGGFPNKDIHVLPFETDSGEQTVGLVVRYPGDGSSGEPPPFLESARAQT